LRVIARFKPIQQAGPGLQLGVVLGFHRRSHSQS
jgi:hypothetical protein